MTNHPNRSRRYRGVEIIRTDSICLSQDGKRLYQLAGAVEKSAEATPFLTTIDAAKRFVDGSLAAAEISH